MNIGAAAKRSGITAKTIRYYEDIGLIEPVGRTAAGYRDYSDEDVHILQFLNRARSLGFSVKQCRDLLSLYRDRNRASADVKAVARGHIADITQKIEELENMRDTLQTLVDKCHGDDRPNCPILQDLSGERDKAE